MSIISLCILLLCIQPFIIWQGMYRDKVVEDKSALEFELSFLVIAPCFIYFYLDTFWYALLLLSCVSLLGGVLAKLNQTKAKRSLPSKDLLGILIAWFFLFSIGYGLANVWEFISGSNNAPIVSYYDVEPVTTDVPLNQVLTKKSSDPFFYNLLPSLYYLFAMICVFLIKAYEVNRNTREKLADFLLLVLGIVGAILPLFNEYYIVSLVINFFVYVGFTNAIIRYKELDPSSGGIAFVYGYAFMMAAVFSLICQGVIWFFSL